MLSELPAGCSVSRVVLLVRVGAAMGFMQLLGAIRPLEFMALAGNTEQRDGHKQQGKRFHRAAS